MSHLHSLIRRSNAAARTLRKHTSHSSADSLNYKDVEVEATDGIKAPVVSQDCWAGQRQDIAGDYCTDKPSASSLGHHQGSLATEELDASMSWPSL